MGYRTILVQVMDDPGNEGRLTAALGLARRFGAKLVGMHVSPPPIVPVGYGEGAVYVGPEIIEAQRDAARVVAERLEASFRRITGSAPDVVWQHREGDPGESFAVAARTADLSIGPRFEVSGIDALAPQIVEQVALAGGGPELVVPAGGFQADLGRRILVGWNGRKEAARAAKDALPFLTAAAAVRVVAIGEEPGETLGAAVAMLERHGVTAEGQCMPETDDAGAALLAAASEFGADLLVMGAYGRSRFRELVLGGATRHVLQNAGLATLLSC